MSDKKTEPDMNNMVGAAGIRTDIKNSLIPWLCWYQGKIKQITAESYSSTIKPPERSITVTGPISLFVQVMD